MSDQVVDEVTGPASRLVIGHDGEEHVLGRPDLGIYVVVAEPGVVFIRALQQGLSLAEATARASHAAGEQVDAQQFLDSLADAGLWDAGPQDADAEAAAIGTAAAPAGRRDRRIREIRWIEGVSPAVARRLFGPVAWTGYALATVFVIATFVIRPDLWPRHEHAWWLPDPVLSVLVMIPIGFLLAALHEVWHWLAGRAAGVPAIFRLSYRGIFLVFETDLTQIVTRPRRSRYGAFLAGMAFDVTVLAVVLATRLAHRVDVISLAGWVDRFLAAVVLMLVIRLVWQWAALFMRSDGYAVLANALRCHDLYRTTWLTTKDRLWGLTTAEVDELATIGERDKRVARWFGLLYLAGLIAMGAMLIVYALPLITTMALWVLHNLLHPSLTSFVFWESVAVVIFTAGPYALIPLLALRERRRRRAGVLR